MAPHQGAEVPDSGGLVSDHSQGEAMVRATGATQEVPGALRHQHEVQGQGDLRVRFAGFLALLEACVSSCVLLSIPMARRSRGAMFVSAACNS